jgi:hypothetical protein
MRGISVPAKNTRRRRRIRNILSDAGSIINKIRNVGYYINLQEFASFSRSQNIL